MDASFGFSKVTVTAGEAASNAATFLWFPCVKFVCECCGIHVGFFQSLFVMYVSATTRLFKTSLVVPVIIDVLISTGPLGTRIAGIFLVKICEIYMLYTVFCKHRNLVFIKPVTLESRFVSRLATRLDNTLEVVPVLVLVNTFVVILNLQIVTMIVSIVNMYVLNSYLTTYSLVVKTIRGWRKSPCGTDSATPRRVPAGSKNRW